MPDFESGAFNRSAISPYLYYQLVSVLCKGGVWTGWQWDRPANRDGIVIVLRRPESPARNMQLELQHLKRDASYEVEIRSTYDQGPAKEMKGSELAHLQMTLPDAPSSAMVLYRQK
jgi:hypothetical protein